MYHATCLPYAGEIERAAVGCPTESVYSGLESFRNVSFCTRLQVQDAQSGTVAFVTVARHAEPRHIFPVGRISRVRVVAHVTIPVQMVYGLVFHGTRRVDFRLFVVGRFA